MKEEGSERQVEVEEWKIGRRQGKEERRSKCNDETKRSSEVKKRGAYKTHTIPLPSKTPDRQNRE